jgi:hypothetical protein
VNQDHLILLLFKIVLVADVVSIAAFIAQYWRLAPWYKNPIGRTIVIKDILLIVCLLPSVLSLFWHFSRLTSHIAAWVDVASFGLIAPVMAWRILVWQSIHKNKAGTGGQGDGDDAS